MELDDVELEFEEGVFCVIVKKVIERNIGVRGFRSIVESVMMEIMFEVLFRDNIKKVIVIEKFVNEDLVNFIIVFKD